MSGESLLGVACMLLIGVIGVIGVLWGIMGYHIAQVNVARALDALNSDVMAGFVACLTSIREVVQWHL